MNLSGPIFSAATAHRLLSQSPSHAWTHHPALNPNYREEVSDTFDLGTAVHSALLEGETAFTIIDAPDFRTKAAREARDAARAAGATTPLLLHTWETVQVMVAAARAQLAQFDPEPLASEKGQVEVSMFFEEHGVACRATPDWLSLDRRWIVELKTTSVSANPAVFSRRLWDLGYAVQSALYRRAVKRLYGVTAEFSWVVLETMPPYALSGIALDPEATALADQQLDAALALWRRCVARNDWPGYPARTCFAEIPPWVKARELERAYFDD